MPPEARLLTGLALSVGFVYLATPIAIRVAARYEFYDRPVGYKGHAAPTPYLGGTAVVAGFLLVVLALTGDWQRTLPLVGGVVLLWIVGTIDDRLTVTPLIRVTIELALAVLLWSLGLGWDLGLGAGVDLALTGLWLVAVVNAFNLFDNMDGATSSMASVVAGGLALLGIVQGDTWLSVVAIALCGACIGFLPHNLASPAKIFLGDGGSMPIGFTVAALVMIGVGDAAAEWQSLAMGLLFVGVPALDSALVIVSRRRRGIPILTGGRDHLTHRTLQRFQTARAVAITLGAVQAVISALALLAIGGGRAGVVAAVVLYLVGVCVAIALLDTRTAPPATPSVLAPPGTVSARRRWPPGAGALALLVPLAVGIGVSPFFYGYYGSEFWVPAGLWLVAVVTAGAIARPPPLSGPSVAALAALAGLAVWALASAAWSESIEQAVVEGNRLLVYVALLGVLLVVLRSERAALALVGVMSATAVGVAGWVLWRMLGDDGPTLFLGGRLDAPLGYINGEAAFFLICLWPCVAAAEQRRSVALAAAGMAAATLLASLTLLSQSRGAGLAAAVSVLVVLALVPGRLRRAWALVVLGGALTFAGPSLLDVFTSPEDGQVPAGTVAAAGRAAALAALAAGLLWGAASAVARHQAAEGRWRRQAAGGGLALLVLMGLALAVPSAGTIGRTLDEQYTAFVRLGVGPQGSGVGAQPATRLASGSGNRYDYWRIAWGTWREHPLRGVGAGNYDVPYFARRATSEDIRQPHSVELQVLSELGLAGAALLLGFLAAVGWGAWRISRRASTSPAARALAAAGTGMVTAWLVHTSVDWIHLLPGVTAMALVAVAVLVRGREPVAPAPVRVRSARVRFAPAVAVAAVLAVAGVSLSRQGLAERFRANGQEALAADPASALRSADRALRLDSEGISSYYLKAAAQARFNQADAAEGTLLEAARREPSDFVTWTLLGDLSVRVGDLSAAGRYYRRGARLNPRDQGLARLARDPASAQQGAG